MRAICLLLALCSGAPLLSHAQGAPGTNLRVNTDPVEVTIRNGATRVAFIIRNDPTSKEELFIVTIDAPAPALTASLPNPQDAWDVSRNYRSRSVVRWGILGEHLKAGASTPTLSFEARGLPSIVQLWAEGYTAPPPLPSNYDEAAPVPDALLTNSVRSSVIGVEPYPVTNPTNLILRLITLQDRACAASLGWVKSATLCQTLKAKLQHAQMMAAQRNNASAKADLTSYVADLSSQYNQGPISGVTASGYWLLKPNAEFIATLLN
jgi:hypothetical protein